MSSKKSGQKGYTYDQIEEGPVGATWQVQEAKSHFSELMDRALRDGPQVITRHGKPVVKVVAVQPATSAGAAASAEWLDFLLNAPKSGLPEGLPPMPRSSRSRKPLFGEE